MPAVNPPPYTKTKSHPAIKSKFNPNKNPTSNYTGAGAIETSKRFRYAGKFD
jgi:hypothetical protein